MKKFLIAGNWKMNKTGAEAAAFAEELKAKNLPNAKDVCVMAPFTAIDKLGKALEGSGIGFGAQNVHFEPKGAFYVFPSIKSTGLTSDEFCEKLLYSHRVALVPGNAFGACGEGFVRVSYSYSLKHLKVALARIREFLEDLHHGNQAESAGKN